MKAIPEPFDIRAELAGLHACSEPGPETGKRYLALRERFEALALPLRRRLLVSPLAWTDRERGEAEWLRASLDALARAGYPLSACAAAKLGLEDECARRVVAATFYYMGETVKWDVASCHATPHDYAKAHRLMHLALDSGRARQPMTIAADGRERACSLESLYFRVMLLARFASGELTGKQMEILDAWMWHWMPALTGVSEPPGGTALRADLDSGTGLQQGIRKAAGPSLYLPQAPLEAAYRELVQKFHEGCIVPTTGIASEFRIEEHVAVMELVRRNLRSGRRPPVTRAERRRVGLQVEVYLGLAEIMKRGLAVAPPPAAPVSLAPAQVSELRPAREVRERDVLGEIYDAAHRYLTLVDESDSGLGLQGPSEEFGMVAAGDLIGIRLEALEPLVIGKVVRSVASRTPGVTFIGVRRMTSQAQPLPLAREDRPESAALDFAYVPGHDGSGRQDALLVSEREFAERAPMVASRGRLAFRLRVNRPRDRGRGWVLAGFEVSAARPAAPAAIQPR